MTPRVKNAGQLPGVYPAIQAIMFGIHQSGLPKSVLDLVGLRVGQMNECALCVSQSTNIWSADAAEQNRLISVADWQNETCFTETERVALAMTEAVTRLDVQYDSVPDALWMRASAAFNETQLEALILLIAMMNMFTRINVATRKVTADWA